MSEVPEDTAKAVEEALAQENPKGKQCIWCGEWHEGFCPRIKCIEFDPITGKVFRYYFHDILEDE